MDRINGALRSFDSSNKERLKIDDIAEHRDRLTPREGEVMGLVVEGLANKVVASRLDISQRTVEIHRARVMEKMGAESLADLVKMSIRLSTQV